MESVRRAESADLGRCRELVAEAVASAEGQRGAALLFAGATPAELASTLVERWRTDDGSSIVLGVFEGVIVGVAAGSVAVSGPRTIGRIECCYVEPEARAVGVGQSMVEALLEFFASRNCSDVDAIALPGDRSSKQLLESSGFKARLLVLHRSLD